LIAFHGDSFWTVSFESIGNSAAIKWGGADDANFESLRKIWRSSALLP
jgi:hypothetical protein